MGWMADGVGRFSPAIWKSRRTATSRSRRATPTRCARRSSPATCCWSKATTTFPASSNISRNRPGRMPRSMSGRSATASTEDGEPLVLVEANIGQGVVAAPLSKYARFHTRICRPTGLTDEDCARVCAYAAERIGFDYDLKNIIDLMRYLFPLPVPQRWRRRMMALGSGHPTRIICSALIAQAFENVRYPILPKVTRVESEAARAGNPGNPPFLAVRAARFRHLALFRGGQADLVQRLRLQGHGLGRPAGRRRRRVGVAGAGRDASRPGDQIWRRYAVTGDLNGLALRPRPAYLLPHDRRRRQSACADVHAGLAPRADEGRRAGAAADRHRRHRAATPASPRWPSSGATWAEQTSGFAPHAAWARSPGCCRSWRASASSPARCS